MPLTFNTQKFGNTLKTVSGLIPFAPVASVAGSALNALGFRPKAATPAVAGPMYGPEKPAATTTTSGNSRYGASTTSSKSSTATKVTTPAAPVVPTAPAADARGRYTGVSDYDKAAADYYGNLDTSAKSEQDYYNENLGRMQGSIDAINNIYDQMVSDEKYAGQGRAGSTRALNARSGLLGSDFGNANAAETERYTDKNVLAINNERAVKIAAILGKINDDAVSSAQKAREQARMNSEQKLAYQKERMDSARKNVEELAKAGVSYDSLTDDEYKKILDQTGYDSEQLKATMIINKPKEDVLEKGTVGGKYYQVVKDPVTGQVKSESFDLGFEVPQDYDTQKTADGRLLFVPKKIDPNKPIGEQVLMYGAAGTMSGSGTGSGGSYKFTQGQKSKLLQNGFTVGDIAGIEQDLRAGHTIDEIAGNQSLTRGQQDALRLSMQGNSNVQGAANIAPNSLNKDYFLTNYGIDALYKSAEKAGYTNKGLFTTTKSAVNKYLDKSVIPAIQKYREQGYTDSEILAKMGKK